MRLMSCSHFFAVPAAADVNGQVIGAVRGVLASVLSMIERACRLLGTRRQTPGKRDNWTSSYWDRLLNLLRRNFTEFNITTKFLQRDLTCKPKSLNR